MNPKNLAVKVRSLAALFCLILFSFALNKGGDSFEIWLNGKQVLQQFVHISNAVQTLRLTATSENDKLDILYSHCGRTGTDRSVSIKDESGRLLKAWKIPDANNKSGMMSFRLRDILSLKRNSTEKLNLFYSSKELPAGRTLVTIVSEGESGVTRR